VIELYYYTSPNCRKILMMLEETRTPYEIRWVDLLAGDQHAPEYRDVNPNGKVPAVIDRDAPGGPLRVFESGAILQYLAETTGQLLSADLAQRTEALCWVHWQVAGQGPALGQAAHFVSHAPHHGTSVPYAIERFRREARRLYQVLDDRLSDREWIVDELSIADLACFPWVRVAKGQGVDIADFPAVRRWSERIAARPSAKVHPEKALGVKVPKSGQYTHDQFKLLFEHPVVSAAGDATGDDGLDDADQQIACPMPPVKS